MHYNLQNIRTLLTEGFSTEELRIFCFDQPDFKPVYSQLAGTTGKTQIVHKLIEYAEQRELFEYLLDWAKKENPIKYKKYQPYHSSIIKESKRVKKIEKLQVKRSINFWKVIFVSLVVLSVIVGIWFLFLNSILNPCTPLRRYEPNDERAQACKINSNQIIEAYPDDEEDIYYFDLEQPASISVVMENFVTNYKEKGEDGYGQLLLHNDGFDKEGYSFAAIRYLQGKGELSYLNQPDVLRDLPPGRYYIRVYTYEGTYQNYVPYQLKLTIKSS